MKKRIPAFAIGLIVCSLSLCGGSAIALDTDSLILIGTFDGENVRDQFGIAVAGDGDLNNDGYPDIIVGANANDDGGDAAGKAYVYFGGSSFDAIADLTVTGGAGDFLGGSVAVIGDINNDGFDDFVIGASFNSDIAPRAGKAMLFQGGDPIDATADLTFWGTAESDYFGVCVAGVGDVNADGWADWAIGAYRADVGAAENTGMVYVYFGGESPDAVPELLIPGNADGERFGYAIAGAGRFNDDEFDDIVVGAYSYDEGGGINLGRAYVYYGGQPMDSLPDLVMTGEHSFDFFGISVAGGGDIDHDGFDDVLVGATGYDYLSYLDAGKCYVYLGGEIPDAVADYTFAAERMNSDALGSVLAILGDLDGDTHDEFAFGAVDDNENGSDAGKVYVFNGEISPPFTLDSTLLGPGVGTSFGASLARTDRFVTGYRGTLATGAWGVSDSSGRVFVYGVAYPATCDCGLWGDVNGDGGYSPIDVVYMVNYVYKNWDARVPLPDCPYQPGDVNCDETVNPVDVVYYVNFVYKNWDIFCPNPCGP